MILVVMVGMSIVFAYVTVYSNSYQTGIGSSVLESMTIEDTWIQPNGFLNMVNITVYNTSTSTNLGTNSGLNITISGIYVNGAALINPSKSTIDFRNYVIGPGKHVTIECQAPNSGFFKPGNAYEFKVVTSRGSNFEDQVQY